MSFPGVPVAYATWQEAARRLADAVNRLLAGKMNATGTVTLTAGAASTTITDARIGRETVLTLTPATANAAAALATTYQTYPNATAGQAVLTHANNAQTDRTFAVLLIG